MMKHLHRVGVTTNSESGVSDITAFYDTFAAMEKHEIGRLLISNVPIDHA